MDNFNPKPIKGNIGGVYFTKTKEAVDPFNLTKYNPNTNQNIILIHLEDGGEKNIVTVNFAPDDSSMPRKGWTSHDFPAIFRGYVDHTVNGEAIPRTFAQYLALVPTLITDLNLNNKKPLSFNATVIQSSGVNLLGPFNTLNDLINKHTPTESLHDNDAIAYVYENGQNGFYKVYFSSASSTWYWGIYQGAISTSLSEVQYNLTGLQVQGGFRNPAPIVPLQDEQYRIIWQHLNELYAQYSVIEGELGELEQEVIELNTAVVKTISKTDTNTIIIGLTRIDNDVNIHAVVNVSSNSYNLLKVVGSDGLEVNPEDIINEIIFEINNTNSALRQAIDDIVDNKITAHNTNSEAHQDIRNDIETAEQNANEYTDEEIIRVEQKVDTHIEDLNNPHGVTAEQVDTYTKLVIDNKDANTLQEAKDYTYSKVEIDNKDTTIMNKANNLENANMFKDVNYNNINGVLTFTKYDNTTKEIDLPLELLVESGYYDEVANELVLVLANSSEIRIPVGNLLTDLDAHNIRFNGSGTNYLTTKTEVESAVKELDTRVKANANDKVDKVTGKGLSTNDFTNNDKNKLDGIEAGAEVNPYSKTQLDNMFGDKVDKNANITAGTHPKITYDEKGLVTGGEALAESDIPNLPPTKITQNASNRFVTDVEKAYWDGKVDADGLEWANILNKPTFSTVATSGAYADLTGKPDLNLKLDKNFSALPTQANPLLTDILVLNRGTTVQNITLGTLLAQVDNEIFEVVSVLPTTGVANKIYLVPSSEPETQNELDEFIWVDSAWEKIGAVSVDLSDYFNKTEINSMLDDKVDKVTGKALSTNDYTNTDKQSVEKIPTIEQDILDLESNKVDKVSGKGLSTNDYTNTDKQSVEKIPTIEQDILDLESNKVDKVAGMGLSTNDYTTTEKNKLSGIASGAEVNVQSDWNATSGDALILNKPIIPTKVSELINDKNYVDENYVNSKLTAVYKFKGSVANYAALPTTDLTIGDVYDVQDTGMNYAWNGSDWDSLGIVIDLSNYYQKNETFTQNEINSMLDVKVDKVSGKGLSTNDFTNNDKNKLDGIEAGAEVNPYSKTQLDNMFDDKVDKNANITAGTHPKITYDEKGLVIGGGPLVAGDIPNLNASKINAGTFTAERIPSLEASKIGSGTFDEARIPSLAPTKITQDASNRFVTDAEKNTWNAKQNALGFTPENVANKKTTLSDSDVDYPTSKAVKTAIETAVSQTLKPMGNWNANTNTPTLTDSNINRANEMYYVSVAGTQFGIKFDVGDELVYNTNGVIFRRDNVDSVVSVNTKQGVVVLNQDDIGDGATYKRVSQAEKNIWNDKQDKLVAGENITIDENTNVISASGGIETVDWQDVENKPELYNKTEINSMLDDKVDKVSGMGLSSNDFTTTEKDKLSGIQAGAQVNAVTTVAGRTGAVVLTKADVGLGSVQNYGISSQAQAIAGTVNTVYMTPLRTKEAITAAMGDIESALDAILGV